ncbi:MAG: hypothetical protein LC792_06105 [Actinobacteria bacterium]|nr:hypothetical protein [Actinomycetota bacterium]
MSSGRCRSVVAGALFAALAAGCGASNGTGAGIPSDTADTLAARAERVAGAIDSGACDQASAEAHALQSDVAALQVDPALLAQAADRAARLVAAIHCPPPTTAAPSTTTAPPTVVVSDPRPGKGKKHKGDHEHDE